MNARTTYPGGKWKELVYDATRAVTNILHTARSTPNTSMSLDAFGNITNAADTAGNSWLFSYASLNILTNEVFTSPRLCDSACETNALARLVDTYSRPVGYNLAIDGYPRSRVRYGYDAEGRIATLVATNAANRGFLVTYLNESGYNYDYGDFGRTLSSSAVMADKMPTSVKKNEKLINLKQKSSRRTT